jgi:hypothetical protein
MRKLFAVLVLVVASLGVITPAVAHTTSTAHTTLTTRGGFVAPRACKYGHVSYKLAVDQASIPNFRSWSADITITGPGHYRATWFLNGPTDPTGWQPIWFCGAPNRAGTYRVHARVDVTHDDSYQGTHTFEVLSTTFVVTTRR